MVGKKSGVAARIREINPWLVQSRCVCHRLQLVCKDSDGDCNEVQNLTQVLRKTYNFISKSSAKLVELKEYQKLRDERQLKVLKFCDIRWLCKFNCVNQIRQIYGSVLDLVYKHKNPDLEKDSKVREKAEVVFEMLASYETLFLVFILSDLLNQVNLVFKKWQSESVHVMDVFGELEVLKNFIILNYLSNENEIGGLFYQELNAKFSNLSTLAENHYINKYKIARTDEEHLRLIKITKKFAKSLLDHLEERFQEANFLRALRIFDVRYLVKNLNRFEKSYQEFTKDFGSILAHFKNAKEILEKEKIIEEQNENNSVELEKKNKSLE